MEHNIRATILGRWSPKVNGLALFGDVHQLAPVNMSSSHFNEFCERGDKTLPTRLIRQGYPHTLLLEQNRSAHALVDFSSERWYEGKLRTSESMSTITLEEQFLGLREVVQTILELEDGVDGTLLRIGWIELLGERLSNPKTQSNVVQGMAST